MGNLRCSNCSFLNLASASACKQCGLPLEYAAGTEWDSQAYAPSDAYPQSTEGGSYFWNQPSYQPNYAPPPVKSSSDISKVALVVVILAVVLLAGFVAIPKYIKNRKTDFAKVSWSEYKSPDAKFSVSLPVVPKKSVVYQQTPMGQTPVTVLDAQVSQDGGCLLMHTDYPVGDTKIPEDAVYEYTLNKKGSLAGGYEMGARRYITHDGHKGLEMELKSSARSRHKDIGVARLFWVSPRIYVLMAIGPDTADFRAVQTRCLDSFKLSSGN